MTSSRPTPNSYWVDPGRLLAGEYPGHPDPDAMREKVRRFLDVGIRRFVDLTEKGEQDLLPYADLLAEEAARRGVETEHVRLSIRDVDVPHSRAHMTRILDTIDEALDRGVPTYVHCWGGTGRTGTVVGCYLVRHGLDGDAALAQIQEWWRTVEKVGRSPVSPQIPEQWDWVRGWEEVEAG